MSDDVLREIRDLIQSDINRRGLATDPGANLINACPDDFAAACHSIAETPNAALCIVTGFYIADADPPAGETDGPLGALFLARALTPLGIGVALATDPFCQAALQAGVDAAGLGSTVPILRLGDDLLPSSPLQGEVVLLPPPLRGRVGVGGKGFGDSIPPPQPSPARGEGAGIGVTHLIALERVGPSRAGRCYSMRGRDITAHMAPAHRLFERNHDGRPNLTTIGIGDGGNEIGMGKISAEVIGRNIPNGERIACGVATDYLIVCGVSNWGAYALAASVALLRGEQLDPSLFDVEKERELLRIMVEQGSLVDGVTGQPTITVDGLSFDEYVKPLVAIKQLLGA